MPLHQVLSWWLWHRRIAHIGMSNLKKAHKRGSITDLKDVTFDKNKLCSACQAGKQVSIHHPLKTMLSTSKPLEILHMDLFGPTTYKSIGGNLYCLVIVDDYSRYTWTMLLGDKGRLWMSSRSSSSVLKWSTILKL